VIATGSAEDALRVCHRGRRLDLLLTDVVMPRASGGQLAGVREQEHPALKVLYMSGHGGDVVLRHAALDPETALLEKPFTARSLLRKVRAVLDGVDAG
jgi:two-component system cell cycle sensor histidine kinase/response regulator CckA